MIEHYSKILQMRHRDCIHIFDGPVLIEEKVDGSQISFGKDADGVVHMRSHHKVINMHNPNKMFALAVKKIKEIAVDDLPPGYIFRGEYLNKPKHNVLAYDRVPKNNIVIFDVSNGGAYLSPDSKKHLAEGLGFECVPVLFSGVVTKRAELVKLLDTLSFLGGSKIEGFVVKQYAQQDSNGDTLMCKYVSDQFKETANHDGQRRKLGQADVVGEIIQMYLTTARWQKAVQHLKEQGKLIGDVKDIGPLVVEVQRDVMDECGLEIAGKLFAAFEKTIKKGVVRGLPEWYKSVMADGIPVPKVHKPYTAEQRRALEETR